MWNRRLGRTADHRVALLKNMATDLILKGKIETTEMKAKELRSVVDHLITVAKKNDLASRRQAAAYLRNVTTKDGKTAVQVLRQAHSSALLDLYDNQNDSDAPAALSAKAVDESIAFDDDAFDFLFDDSDSDADDNSDIDLSIVLDELEVELI